MSAIIEVYFAQSIAATLTHSLRYCTSHSKKVYLLHSLTSAFECYCEYSDALEASALAVAVVHATATPTHTHAVEYEEDRDITALKDSLLLQGV